MYMKNELRWDWHQLQYQEIFYMSLTMREQVLCYGKLGNAVQT